MKKNEIRIGGHYLAKVSGKLITVRVDAIREVDHRYVRGGTLQIRYDVTNLSTGRKTTFRSAAKFRSAVITAKPSRAVRDRVESIIGKPIAEPGPVVQLEEVEHRPETRIVESPPSGNLPRGVVTEVEQRPDPTPAPDSTRRSSPASAAAPVAAPPVPSPRGSLAAALRAQAAAAPVDDSPHLIVEARAGTGKTTTLVEGLRRIKGCPTPGFVPSPQQAAVFAAMEMSRGKINTICFVAFNKSIADELKTRVPAGCDAMTMHSMGFRAVRKAFPRVDAGDRGKWLVADLIAEVAGRDIRELRRDPRWVVAVKATEELVGLCKMNLIDDTHPTQTQAGLEVGYKDVIGDLWWADQLDKLASHYNVDLNGSRDRVFDIVPKVLERCKDVAQNGRIDYNDMIWLPVVLGLPLQRYDLLLVDERQDLNKCQMQLALRAGKRIVAVGDEKQSIYGFAGADANACANFTEMLKRHDGREVVQLPLTVTRRCGKAIVEEARKIVPDFEAHESNGSGKISSDFFEAQQVNTSAHRSYRDEIKDGDFVLCRVNAPLVSECFRFLKAGRKANIQGRDVGKGLTSTVEKLAKGEAISVVELIRRLGEWLAHEQAKENAKREPSENRMTALQDRHDCLLCFCDGAAASTDVIAKINAVFTDDKKSPGIKLSSIHKAKGLEARRVFILQPKGIGPRTDKMKPWELEQESNLRYVAITRAIEELIFVS